VDGRDYQDNAARFIYFTKCVVELAGKLNPAPQILYANGGRAALLPVLSSGDFHSALFLRRTRWRIRGISGVTTSA
jgi:glycogen synthase